MNKFNPSFMCDIFLLKLTNSRTRFKYKLNLDIPKIKQVKFGTTSLQAFGSKIWSSLPHHRKSAENLITFKTIIKNYNRV